VNDVQGSIVNHDGSRAHKGIRVLLVDDFPAVRQTLRSVLSAYSDFEVVGEAGDGEQAVESVRALQPSVVVMDISMPKLNGIEATALIKEAFPHVVIVGLSLHVNEHTRNAMKAAGASALISKEAAVEQLQIEILESINKQSTADH
jgi:DNA-binding NarL/FixJ family response regulator